MPIEIVFDMLGFNMLNPKMKNHPPFVLPRLSNMQRSQHTKLLRRNKDSFWNFLACLSYSNESNLKVLAQSSTTLYYKVLAQYYSVLQSTTPVLLCTTQCYSSTTLYYKALLRYYSVLQSTTPVLLCTTKYYSTTTLYYTVLLQYYSVLQTTTPVLLCTTPVLLCTTKYYSGTRKYCSSTTPALQSTTPVLICTTKYLHTWNVIYNARRSNKSQPPTSASTAPARKNDSRDQSSSHMKRYLQCAEEQVSLSKLTKYCACHEKWISWLILVTHETLFTMRGATRVIVQTHQILRLPRKMNLMLDPCHTWNAIYNARRNKCHCPNSPNTAPATKNESHDWSLSHMKRYLQCAEQHVSLSKLTKYCACHEKWISWLILVTHETLFTMRGATSVIVQTHQILRLPRKMNLMIDPCHTWKAIYNARSNKCHCPDSPNTAPATKNESHDWSLSHMKCYLQCAEQQVSLSKLTKYCACHAKWLSKILQKFLENSWNVISNAGPIREWSEQDPRMIRAGSENETVTPQPASQARLLFTPTTRILYWKIQLALRLSFQISPNTAPATKSDISTFNFTKYCACHEKWISWLILVTHETLFTMRGATSVIVQTHQILRLPRKMTLVTNPLHTWNAIYNARSNTCHCPNSPNTAPATKNESHDWSLSHMKRYLQCAEQQASLSKLTTYCACHAKWLSKILQKFLENRWNVNYNARPIRDHSELDPSRIREWSENDPRMKPSLRNPPRKRGYFSRSPRAFSIEKYNSRSGYHSKFHQILRLPRKVTLQLHQILRLPRKMTLMINPRHTWNAIYNARNNRWHPPTSPNTAPATPNDSPKFQKHFSKTDETSITMRDRSETIPSWIRAGSDHETVIRNPPCNRGYFSRPPRPFCIENYNISRSGYHSKFHRMLRLPRKVTVQHHQILRLPRKVPLERHQIVHLPRKVTLERHQIVHLPRKVTLELHQTVHLPRKVTLRYSTLLEYSPLFSYESLLKRI